MWLLPVVPVALLLIAVLAREILKNPAVSEFVVRYPGTSPLPAGTPVGIPVWLNVLHFVNILFMAFIVRTALNIRSKQRPPHFVTRNNTGLIRTAGAPRRMSIHVWLHLAVDVLWVLAGLIYVILLFSTGQWMRIVPTSWDVFPNAASAGLQFLAFQWPVENAWVSYNALQLLTYFVTVFIAAPVAILTGIRLSNAWPQRENWVRAIPEKPIRWIHNATLVYFIAFVIIHVLLVVSTGLLRNLNVMFAANDSGGWIGLVLCVLGLDLIMALLMIMRPPAVAALARLFGKVQ